VLSPYISGLDCSESSCMRRVVSCLCTLNGFGTLVSAVSGSILSYRRPNYWSGGGLLIKNTVTCAIDRVEYASIWESTRATDSTSTLSVIRKPYVFGPLPCVLHSRHAHSRAKTGNRIHRHSTRSHTQSETAQRVRVSGSLQSMIGDTGGRRWSGAA